MFFIRESEGVYSYCKKKVMIKIENEKLVLRVGGGFMQLEEFVDAFNPFKLY